MQQQLRGVPALLEEMVLLPCPEKVEWGHAATLLGLCTWVKAWLHWSPPKSCHCIQRVQDFTLDLLNDHRKVTSNTFIATLTGRGILNTEVFFFDLQTFQQRAPILSSNVDNC